jgi:LemA protein
MTTPIIILLILIGVVVLIGAFIWSTYNSLVTLRMRVKEAWSDIDVQLKKRYDLLPDLIETVRKAVSVDETILTKVTELRSAAMESSVKNVSPEKRGEIEQQLSGAIRDIKVQVEAYPDIKSHMELTNLMDKVTEIEEKIAYSRRFYNQNVMELNTKIEMFPQSIVAGMFSFNKEAFFEATAEERKDVKVSF